MSSPPTSHRDTTTYPSTPPIRRCSRRGTSSTRRCCIGLLGRCSRYGVPPRSTSPKTVAAPPTWWPTTGVYDSDRVMFLRACLGQLQRATAEGVPVDGYFLWRAQDNFEWMDGYGTRFGLIYVDFDTLERTPKLSAEWFREASRRN